MLHLNVPEMFNEENHHHQFLRLLLSTHNISFEKSMDILRESPYIYLRTLDLCDIRKPVTVLIRCLYDPSRWEQILVLDP